MSVKSTSFSLMGMVWPLQKAQPAGAKLPPNILISPTYGSGILAPPLVMRREDALEGDDEVQHEVGHPVLVRLRPADVRDARGVERDEVLRHRAVGPDELADDVTGRGGLVAGLRVALREVQVLRHLADGQRVHGLARGLAERGAAGAAVEVDGDAAAEVGQREGGLAVAAEGGAEQGE